MKLFYEEQENGKYIKSYGDETLDVRLDDVIIGMQSKPGVEIQKIEVEEMAELDIDLDPASCEEANKIVKASKYYSLEVDGLSQSWTGNIWLNPPFSQVSKFIDKLLDSDINQAIVLVNNATETGWFKQIATHASAIVFHTGRLRFMKPGHIESAPMQGQCFIYLGNRPEAFLSEFSQYGWGTRLG